MKSHKTDEVLAGEAPQSRIFRQLPLAELERRWSLIRAHMREAGIQGVIAFGADDFIGGYVRWLCDRPATNAYPAVAVFHAEAPMTVIEHGALDDRRDVLRHPEYRGTEEVFTTTSWRSVRSTYRNEAEIVCRVLRSRGYRRVGMIGAGGMPFAFVQGVAELGIEIIDLTDFIDRCKAIKSSSEIEEIQATAAMQDEVFTALLEQIKPGMRELDVGAIAQFEGRKRGSEQGIFMVASRPIGQPTLLAPAHYQNRRFERGDHLSVLIENNGPTGYYAELGRTIVLGKATPALLDAMDLAVGAQQNTLGLLRAGVACRDIAAAHDTFTDAHGLQRETRLYAHGQGYDLVEPPLVRADEDATVEVGMNIVVHPSFVAGGAFGYVCDNFIVQPDGPPRPVHQTEQKIFEI